MSSEDPETVARIMEGATPAQAYRGEFQEDIIAGNPVAARGTKFIQGVPFAGQYTDEIIGAVAGDDAQSGVRALQDAMQEERPGESMALQMAGGVTGSIPLAVAAAPAVATAAPTSIAGQTALGAGAGATAGAVEGAVSGFGRGRTMDERIDNARGDAFVGGATGGALGLLAPGATKGIKNLIQWVKNSDVGVISSALGVSKNAARIIRDQLGTENMAKAVQTLSDVGEKAMLADSGPASQNLLDTVMSTGGGALQVGREAVERRAAASGPKLKAAFDAILGKPKGVKTAAKDIAKGSAKARKTAYEAAYRQPINYASPEGQAIEEVVDRIPQGTLKDAVKEANEAMQAAGKKNLQIMARELEDGTFELVEMPNVQQLDELKKALGAIAEQNKDQFGRLNSIGLRASSLARELKKATSDAVPVYGRAVALGGDKIAEDNALALGRSVLERGTALEDVVSAMDGASKAEKTAFKQGLREALEDGMSNVRMVSSDQNIDARQVRDAIFKLSSEANQNKIRAAIGDAATDKIMKLVKEELPQLQTRAAVARGSQTAYREAGRQSIEDTLSPGIMGRAARGKPVEAVQTISQALTDTTTQADAGRKAAVLQEVAEALTQTRGESAARLMKIIDDAMAGQPITDAQARQIAVAIVSSGALTSYQGARKALESQ